MKEQRRSSRVAVNVYVNKYVSGTPYVARIADISPHGLLISRLLEPDVPKRRLGLQFQLPGTEEVIYAEGEVVRETGARAETAVRFTLLTERHRKLIHAYVERQAS
jgi:hypothetical protein